MNDFQKLIFLIFVQYYNKIIFHIKYNFFFFVSKFKILVKKLKIINNKKVEA